MTWIDRTLAKGAVARRVVDELNEAAPVFEKGALAEVSAAPLRGMLSLRGDLEASAMAAAVEAATGFQPPTALSCQVDGAHGVYWMSPDELLLTTPIESLDEAYARAGAALKGTHHLLVDVSDARQIFSVTGSGARDVLAKGAPLDLDPQKFREGAARRTRLAQVAAMIALVSSEPEETFEVFCFRSYAPYVQRFLRASAAPGTDVDLFETTSAKR